MDRRTALLSLGIPLIPTPLLLPPSSHQYEVTHAGVTYEGLLYYDTDLEPEDEELLYEHLRLLHIDPDFNVFVNYNVVVGDKDIQARIHCHLNATSDEIEEHMRAFQERQGQGLHEV